MAPILPFSGLDLAHVVHSIEWLAQLHALSYVVLNRHRGGAAAWLSENRYHVIIFKTIFICHNFQVRPNSRWIRSEDDDRRDLLEPNGNGHSVEEGDDHVDSAVANSSRTKLAKMAVEAIKVRNRNQ